jgi:hypothetical protein
MSLAKIIASGRGRADFPKSVLATSRPRKSHDDPRGQLAKRIRASQHRPGVTGVADPSQVDPGASKVASGALALEVDEADALAPRS